MTTIRTFTLMLAMVGLLSTVARAADPDEDGDRPAPVPSRAVEFDGQPALKLDARTLAGNGIEVATLHAAPWQRQVNGYGVVLDPIRLIDLANRVVIAREQLQGGQARLSASTMAFDRARNLYRSQQNVSLAQLQAAEATYRTDQAALAVANSQIRTLGATALQGFGPVVSQAIEDGGPLLGRLLAGRQVIVQVTLTPDSPVPSPQRTATLRGDDGSSAPLDFLSPASTVDPRVQGTSILYLGAASGQLLPGMNVLVSLPSGPAIEGVSVPGSAVVWWEDRAWIYLETAKDIFVRAPIATDLPSGDGYIVRDLPNDPVVTKGAQLLLSEEFRAQLRGDND